MTTAGSIKLGDGLTPGWGGAGNGSFYFDSATGQPYALNSQTGLPTALGGGGGGGGSVGGTNIVYCAMVANGGDDLTGTRGDAGKPFASIKAALAACQSGDILRIGPGRYEITAVGDLPAWPAGVDKLIIEGSGAGVSLSSADIGDTSIYSTVGGVIFQPPATAQYVEVRDLRAHASDAVGYPFVFDGTGGGGAFLGGTGNGALVLRNVVASTTAQPSLVLRNCGIVLMTDCLFNLTGGSCAFSTSNIVRANNVVLENVTLGWDDTDPDKPGIGNVGYNFSSAGFKDLTLEGQAHVEVRDCNMRHFTGNALSASGGQAPQIRAHSTMFRDVDFYSAGKELPDTAATLEIRFSNCVVTSYFRFKVGGAAANPQSVRVDGCMFRTDGFGDIKAGEQVFIDLRTSRTVGYPTVIYDTPDVTGGILPAPISIAAGPHPLGSSALTVPFGFRTQTPGGPAVPCVTQVTPTSSGVTYYVSAVSDTDVDVTDNGGVGVGFFNLYLSW